MRRGASRKSFYFEFIFGFLALKDGHCLTTGVAVDVGYDGARKFFTHQSSNCNWRDTLQDDMIP
jgi:hypothetical protein